MTRTWQFKSCTTWHGAKSGNLSMQNKPSLDISSLAESGGEPSSWAPEDLLLGAVQSSHMLTFLERVQERGIHPLRLEYEATDECEKKSSGMIPDRIALDIYAEVLTANEAEQLEDVIDRLGSACPVCQTLICPVDVCLHVSVRKKSHPAPDA